MTHIIKSIVLDNKHPIYMGIDVHKKTWSYTLLHQSQIIERASIPGETEVLLARLKKFGGFRIYSVYEAGFSGYFLCKALLKAGIENIIVAPNKILVLTGDRVKTDKIDSLKLATFLSKGLLRGIHIPTDELIEFRQILRTRKQVKEVRQTLARQIKGLLMLFHIHIPEQGISLATQEKIKKMDLPPHILNSIERVLELFNLATFQVRQMDQLAKNSPYHKTYARLRKVPGLGPITAYAYL